MTEIGRMLKGEGKTEAEKEINAIFISKYEGETVRYKGQYYRILSIRMNL